MGKVTEGELDAVVLAYAGLSRVDLGHRATEVFDPSVILPAPAQGALAIECRADDEAARAAVDKLLDAAAFTCARAERIVLNRLEAGCTAPVASHSTIDADGTIHLTAGVYALDGSAQLVYTGSGTDPVAVGEAAAADLLGRGAADLIAKERPAYRLSRTMAVLKITDRQVTVALDWWEKLAARRSHLTIPTRVITGVSVVGDACGTARSVPRASAPPAPVSPASSAPARSRRPTGPGPAPSRSATARARASSWS